MCDNIRWSNDVKKHLIKNVTMEIVHNYWQCKKCQQSYSLDLPKPDICKNIISSEIDFDKLYNLYITNQRERYIELYDEIPKPEDTMSKDDMIKEYHHWELFVKNSEGYSVRKEHEILQLFDDEKQKNPENVLKNIVICNGTDIKKESSSSPLDSFDSDIYNLYKRRYKI